MSSPIHFMGKDYASADDMPAFVRMAYDKTLEEGNLDQDDEVQVGRASQPWKQGKSGGIAVPDGFEVVTELGPAKHIFKLERDSLRGSTTAMGIGLLFFVAGLMPAVAALFVGTSGDADTAAGLMFGGLIPLIVGAGVLLVGLRKFVALWTGIQALVTYRDGFAFRKGRSITATAWNWSEIASILSKETLHVSSRGSSSTSLTYLLSNQKGETITIGNDQFQDIHRLIDILKRHAAAVLLPSYKEAYESGQPVTFGAVTVSKPDGLTADGKQFAWSDIADVEVKHGRLVISTKQAGLLGGVHNVRASKIPNIEILCQLIGIDPWSINLIYI